jgi:hypothetical protein
MTDLSLRSSEVIDDLSKSSKGIQAPLVVDASVPDDEQLQEVLLSTGQAILLQIEPLDGVLLVGLARVTQAERRELRVAASSSESNTEGGSARALFEQRLLPLSSAMDSAFVLMWLHTFRSFVSPRLLFDNLVDRFLKPLRRFAALAPLDARFSSSQRNALVSRTRAQVCYVLDCWLRHYVCDFLDDDALFADCCAFLSRSSSSSSSSSRPRSGLSGNYSADAAEALSQSPAASADDGGDLLRSQHKRQSEERHAGDYQLKANLFVTMQEEIGGARRTVRVARDALTSELLWALLQCGENGLSWEESELANGRFARFARGADIAQWICELVGSDERAFALRAAQELVSAQLLMPRAVAAGGGATAFADSQAVWYRVSSETAQPFYRKRPPYEAPSKKMLKYAVDDADPKSRSLLDFHPVEVARQLALVAHADFLLVRPSELMSRAWMKDSPDVHAKLCPNIKRIINQFNRLSRLVASEIVRVTDDAHQRLSVLKRCIELALCCRDVQNLHGMYAIYVGLNQWAVQRLKGLWEKLPTKWEKRYEELDQLCNPKSNSAAMRALLRSMSAPVVPPIDLMLRDLTALGEMDEHLESLMPHAPPLPPSDDAPTNVPPPLPLQAEHEWACSFDDTRLLNLNKKRREADVLRRVRRCQRSQYVFVPYAEIERYFFHVREPFDDAQLSALSNLCEPSHSAAANAVDSEAVLAPLKAAGDLPQQGRARAGSVSSHDVVEAVHADAVVTGRGAVVAVGTLRRPDQRPGPQPPRVDARAPAIQRQRSQRSGEAGRSRDRAPAPRRAGKKKDRPRPCAR